MNPTRPPLLLLLALVACPGSSPVYESGAAQCTDGVDNDGDGLIDCQDPDCQRLAICAASDGPLAPDSGPQDTGAPPPDRARDLAPPAPDLPPASSLGRRCQFSTQGVLCADGKSECVPAKYDSPGFCTRSCVEGALCADAPPGAQAHCGYQMFWPSGPVWYCLFNCLGGAPCPNDLQCYEQKFCF